jgi:para-aminobenzoate synthetase component 1
MRVTKSFPVSDHFPWFQQLLAWTQLQSHIIWLESNVEAVKDSYATYDWLIGADIHQQWDVAEIEKIREEKPDWYFGYFSYDYKNQIHGLTSSNPTSVDVPDAFFFQPKKVIYLQKGQLFFSYLEEIQQEIEVDYLFLTEELYPLKSTEKSNLNITSIGKETYLEAVQKVQQHIQRGDIYETNYCMEFVAKDANINPWQVFQELNRISKAPMSVFAKVGEQFLLSASPERYLKRTGNQLISQPIKGTAKRGKTNEEDGKLKTALRNDPKEQMENVMIVDMVRNDLSRLAVKNSVQVQELFGIYTFEQVHQMISTIVAEVKNETYWLDIIHATFPMGSMTGAPKISAMKITEGLETFQRGWYSGTFGYITPTGDFDFNVVIRSIQYDASKKIVSFGVGSAITIQANPELEYEECLLKAKAMREVLIANH